jgi:hypothetical protein
MPNRIIKESIARSEKISGLTDFQFRLWVHLITYVDDFGRGDARAAIIKGSCFPFRERLANKDIEKGIAELADAGCVGLYKVDGKPYLYLPNWDEHQRVRNKVSRFPSPEDADEDISSAASCVELPQVAARIQNPESESRIQNPNPEFRRAQAHEDDFERFWSMYPRKEGKQKAKSAFSKINVDIEVLLTALDGHKRSAQWAKNNGEFIPHASTWLNGKRWEDELVADYSSVPKGASGKLGEAELYAIQSVLQQD